MLNIQKIRIRLLLNRNTWAIHVSFPTECIWNRLWCNRSASHWAKSGCALLSDNGESLYWRHPHSFVFQFRLKILTFHLPPFSCFIACVASAFSKNWQDVSTFNSDALKPLNYNSCLTTWITLFFPKLSIWPFSIFIEWQPMSTRSDRNKWRWLWR